MLLEVVETDFIDNVSASMLSSESESETICLMVLFISTKSYTPGGSSVSKKSFSIPNSGKTKVVLS